MTVYERRVKKLEDYITAYEKRVEELEDEDLSRSDAQSIADMEFEMTPAYDDYYQIAKGTLL